VRRGTPARSGLIPGIAGVRWLLTAGARCGVHAVGYQWLSVFASRVAEFPLIAGWRGPSLRS
jgi:hypothetical protein